MIVAAVNINNKINQIDEYTEQIFNILKICNPPIQVIRWNTTATIQTYDKITSHLGVYNANSPDDMHYCPESFIELLPQSMPIDLYIFTANLMIDNTSIENCKRMLQKRNIQFNSIQLHYLGEMPNLSLKLSTIFDNKCIEIFFNSEKKGEIKPNLDFTTFTYQNVMQDDSIMFTTLVKLYSPYTDEKSLKNTLLQSYSRILKNTFKKYTIEDLYKANDIPTCINYIQNNTNYDAKVDFQRKISDILKLFNDSSISSVYDHIPFYSFEEQPSHFEMALKCRKMSHNMLLQNGEVIMFPVKTEKIGFKLSQYLKTNRKQHPFFWLDSEYRNQICQIVEKNCFNDMYSTSIKKNNRVFVLNNGKIPLGEVVRHNNSILCEVFENNLPHNPILWHIIFLYILAKDCKQLKDMEKRLLEEIHLLGDSFNGFINCSRTNPPIEDKLNVCFWYLANVASKAFPKSIHSFRSRSFLTFYKDVYNKYFDVDAEFPLRIICTSTDNKVNCIICLDEERQILFENCKHFVTCEACSAKLIICPVCRKNINDKKSKIYFT